jgi:fimbrial chaperone protein
MLKTLVKYFRKSGPGMSKNTGRTTTPVKSDLTRSLRDQSKPPAMNNSFQKIRNLRITRLLEAERFAFRIMKVGVAIFLASMAMTGSAYAGAFMVNPTRIELGVGQLSATLVIRNDDRSPSVIQLESRLWEQKDSQDLYLPTKELLVTPPIVTVAAGAEQIVRIALRRPLDPDKELSYRIFLQEVPPPPQPGFSGLQVALRVSLPVFAKPGDSVLPKAVWSLAYQAKEHALRVGLANNGNAHLQFQEFQLFAPGNETALANQQTVLYLLPGQRHEWLIKLDPSVHIGAERLHLKAVTDAGDWDQELDLEKP